MTSPSSFRKVPRVMHHFASTRILEVLALQASPVLGMVLGGFNFESSGLLQSALLLLGSLFLTAHVFVINDWAGHENDIRDPRRTASVFGRQGISRLQVAGAATALLLLAVLCFVAVSAAAVLIGLAISTLSILYSCSPGFGKSTPVAASFNHLLGGSLHFLLGYTLFRPVDTGGIVLGLFFGLVFAAGHLNQEIRDYEGDLLNGIRTSAVVFGCRRTFLVSLGAFAAAYALLTVLAGLGVLPRLLLASPLLFFVQAFWSWQALQRGLGFETAVWMQKRYRFLFALIGLAMLMR